MRKAAKREARFAFADGFEASAKQLAPEDSKEAGRIKDFMICKGEIPPRRLPGTMNDHALGGAFSEFKECHLAGNVLLLYTHKGDLITLYRVCTHDDIHGKRGARYARTLRK
jgi:mRNA-degrading endonuclease YafQ of YafQ-DinJ toxin-antitoxin module